MRTKRKQISINHYTHTLRWERGLVPNFARFFSLLKPKSSFRFQMELGFMLQDKLDPSIKRGYYPSQNTSLFPSLVYVNNLHDLEVLVDRIMAMDFVQFATLKRESSNWHLDHIMCSTLHFYEMPSKIIRSAHSHKQPPKSKVTLCGESAHSDKSKIGCPKFVDGDTPPQLENNRYVISLKTDLSNRHSYRDNLCFLRALTLHEKMSRKARTENKMSSFEK